MTVSWVCFRRHQSKDWGLRQSILWDGCGAEFRAWGHKGIAGWKSHVGKGEQELEFKEAQPQDVSLSARGPGRGRFIGSTKRFWIDSPVGGDSRM